MQKIQIDRLLEIELHTKYENIWFKEVLETLFYGLSAV
jgi:hypothetical protein